MIRDDPTMFYDELPPVARPFFRQKDWRDGLARVASVCDSTFCAAFIQCIIRISGRLNNGMFCTLLIALLQHVPSGHPPRPNCTGEEMALRMLIERARCVCCCVRVF